MPWSNSKMTEEQKTQLTRAMYAGLLWGAVSYGITAFAGAEVDLAAIGTEGGLMAVSYYGADQIHDMMSKDKDGNWKPDAEPIDQMTHSLYTAGLFAGLQRVVRGSDALVQNALAGAGVSYLEDQLYTSMTKGKENETAPRA